MGSGSPVKDMRKHHNLLRFRVRGHERVDHCFRRCAIRDGTARHRSKCMKVGAAIAEILKREGIEILTGYPVNHLIEFAAALDIRPIMVRQERIGLHMADAISRLTSGRKVGVFCMQHGPGTENAYGGVAQAFAESVPILVVPGGYPRRIAHVAPNYDAVTQMRGITKSAEPVVVAAEVPNLMRRAFSRLRNGRGGPVLVQVPADLWQEELPGPLDYTAI